MKKIFLLLAAIASLVGCSPKNDGKGAVKHEKCLVVYYSQTGATAKVAQEISQQTGIDTLRIEAENPYNGTFEETIARCQKEMADSILPKLTALDKNIAAYDTIFLGYPIWFGTYAPPVASLIQSGALRDKVIIPFCTFGSGGLESSVAHLKETVEEANVLDGYGVRNARVAKSKTEITEFLIGCGFAEGETVKHPDFSAQQPVGDEEKAIFDKACGDYPMPIGTPVSAGKRTMGDITEYLFTVTSPSRDGSTVSSSVYVTVAKDEKPEFTRVVR